MRCICCPSWSDPRQYRPAATELTADAGYCTTTNFEACQQRGLDAYITTSRQQHGQTKAQAIKWTAAKRSRCQRPALDRKLRSNAGQFALEHWSPAASGAPCMPDGVPLTYLNVGAGVDLSIAALAEVVATCCSGEIRWDASQPDGTLKKQLDVSRLAALCWWARIPLAEGLEPTVAAFRGQR